MSSELHLRLSEATTAQIRDAESKVSRLHQEIEETQRQISDWRKLLAALAPFVHIDTPGKASNPNHQADVPELDLSDKPIRHADVAESVLSGVQGPLHISEIITGMLNKGQILPPDPQQRQSAVYSAMLRRPNTFCRVGGGKWDLVNRSAGAPTSTIQDFSEFDMSELAEYALQTIGRPSTTAQLVDKLEELGLQHKRDKRTTYTSMHKSMVRSPDKFRKIEGDNPGVWDLVRGHASETTETRSKNTLFPAD